MYEIRNELKMNVSLSRKIHIIALPHGTFLNARWSDDQSATMPCMPSASGSASVRLVSAGCVIGYDPSIDGYSSNTRTGPPRRAAGSANTPCTAPRSSGPCHVDAAPTLAVALAQTPQAAQQVDAVQRGEQDRRTRRPDWPA